MRRPIEHPDTHLHAVFARGAFPLVEKPADVVGPRFQRDLRRQGGAVPALEVSGVRSLPEPEVMGHAWLGPRHAVIAIASHRVERLAHERLAFQLWLRLERGCFRLEPVRPAPVALFEVRGELLYLPVALVPLPRNRLQPCPNCHVAER